MSANAVAARAGRSWTTVLDGTRLRQLRREHGLSQEQLADRAGNQPDYRGQAGTPVPGILPRPDTGPARRGAR